MKLKKFTPENCVANGGGKTSRPASITIKKTGYVAINKNGVALLKLKEGDQVIILQDEDENENWYLQKVDAGGFVLRVKQGTCLLQNSALVKQILDSLSIKTDKAVRMLIAGQPTKIGKEVYWGILTSSASWNGKV